MVSDVQGATDFWERPSKEMCFLDPRHQNYLGFYYKVKNLCPSLKIWFSTTEVYLDINLCLHTSNLKHAKVFKNTNILILHFFLILYHIKYLEIIITLIHSLILQYNHEVHFCILYKTNCSGHCTLYFSMIFTYKCI